MTAYGFPEEERPEDRRRRRLVTVMLTLLAIGAGAIATNALSFGQRAGKVVPVTAAHVSVAGGTRWAWAGGSICQAGTATRPLISSRGPGNWVRHRVPLVTVTAVSAVDADSVVVAGRDRSCDWQVLRSDDGGDTWQSVVSRPVADIDATPDGGMWLVPKTELPQDLVRLDPGSTKLRNVRVGCPALGLTDVSSRPGQLTYALCQDEPGTHRLLLRRLAGGLWERETDERPGTGLGAIRGVTDIDMRAAPVGWLIADSVECPEGQLRRTLDDGGHWQRAPCLTGKTHLGSALSLSFPTADEGAVLGIRGGQPYIYETTDSGGTWTPIATPADFWQR